MTDNGLIEAAKQWVAGAKQVVDKQEPVSIAVATTGLSDEDVAIALAVYDSVTEETHSIVVNHRRNSHPGAYSYHRISHKDSEHGTDDFRVFVNQHLNGRNVIAYNSVFDMQKLYGSLQDFMLMDGDASWQDPAAFELPACRWYSVMPMAQRALQPVRMDGINAGAINKSPRFVELMRLLGFDDELALSYKTTGIKGLELRAKNIFNLWTAIGDYEFEDDPKSEDVESEDVESEDEILAQSQTALDNLKKATAKRAAQRKEAKNEGKK